MEQSTTQKKLLTTSVANARIAIRKSSRKRAKRWERMNIRKRLVLVIAWAGVGLLRLAAWVSKGDIS